MRFQRVGALEELLSRILIVGVLASTAVIALGLVLLIPDGTGNRLLLAQLLAHHATIVAGLPTSLAVVLTGVLHGQPVAVIDLGVLLLILTPVLRVALAAVFFALHGDLRYTLISGVVLLLLILGFILGRVT